MQAIKRKIRLAKSIDSIGALILGLGLYAKYGANADAIHKYLSEDSVVFGLLLSGVVLLAIGAILSIVFTRAKNNLARKPRA